MSNNLVLYRKYRPQSFSSIIGQEHVVKTLTNALKLDKVAHAYLFTGPRGTGKTSMARLLAKAVNCEKRKNSEPCNKCLACSEISQGKSLDLIEIDAASNRGIDEIRELRDGIKFIPNQLKYKVFVIDECLTKDHLITMADGSVRKISEIRDGDKIYSIDLKTGKLVVKKVKNWFRRKTRQIIEVRTPQTTIKCTSNHRLWILRDSKLILVEAKKLNIGDFLLSPVRLPHKKKNNLTPEQLRLLALIQCDGHISKDSITIQIEIGKDRNYFERVAKEGFKAWKIKERPTVKTTSRGTKLIRIYSKDLKKLLTRLGCPEGSKSSKIDIPNEVFQAPAESIKAYINTCFCCEGDIIPFGSRGNINYRLNFSSASEDFTKKLQLLLKKFGIGSNFLKIRRKNKKHFDSHRLSLSGYNLRLYYQEGIGIDLKRKEKMLKRHFKKKEKQDVVPIERLILEERKKKKITYSQLASNGIYPSIYQHISRKSVNNYIKLSKSTRLDKYLKFQYEKVKKINKLDKEEYVYDFTVGGTHTFVADGMVSSNCHQLTGPAFNALLKTLEEPPAHAIFILATTEIHKVPQTIISRCQKFDFHKLTLDKIVQRLSWIAEQEKVNIEKPALELIALNADGSIRDGESLLGQIISLEDKKITLKEVQTILGVTDIKAVQDLVQYLTEKENSKAISHINQVAGQGYDLIQFTKSLISYLRKMLILKIDPDLVKLVAAELTKEQIDVIIKQGDKFSQEDLIKTIHFFIKAGDEIKRSDFQQLPLELAIVECCEN